MKTYDYQLGDNGGTSTAWEQEILIPIGTKFLHEFGLYEVTHYRDMVGEVTRITAEIDMVMCERLKSNIELKKEKEQKNAKHY